LINTKAPGSRAKLNDEQRQALAKIVESGPIPAIHGVVRWRRKDLVQWLFQEFRVSVDETTVGRELKALGFAKLTARPRHTPRTNWRVRFLKRFPRRAGRDQSEMYARHGHRNLVGRRSQNRAKEQDHAPLGTPRNPTVGPARPAHHVDLYLRRDLPEKGQRSWPRPSLLRHRGDAGTPCRNQQRCRSRRARSAHSRPGRMARHTEAESAGQHHLDVPAAAVSGIEPGRECVAIHERQLVVEPRLQGLRRHRRSMLSRVEQARRSAVEDHVHG